MIWRKTMNNEHNKNEALKGPLIFTIPTSRFLVALNLDRLDGTDRAVVAPKKRGLELSDNSSENSKEFEGGVERKAGSCMKLAKR
jgi:hypothetical protein